MMKIFLKNQKADLIQKAAWMLVRSAEDRFEAGKGQDKREWCVLRAAVLFPDELQDRLEDAVRAAYINFRIETGEYNRRLPRL